MTPPSLGHPRAVTTFRATNQSQGLVRAPREVLWQTLTDPATLTKLTPMLQHVEVVGELDGHPLWRWTMAGIDVLGLKVRPEFTEQMVFTAPSAIDYRHAPPAGTTERAAVEGWYRLTDVSDDAGAATHLEISIEILLDLPLPRVAGRAVSAAMGKVIDFTGEKFEANLYAHLGESARP